jgi:hypothetical protein
MASLPSGMISTEQQTRNQTLPGRLAKTLLVEVVLVGG